MEKEVQVVVFPEDGDLRAAYERVNSQARSAGIAVFALTRKAALARQLDRYAESAQISLDAMRLAFQIAREGDEFTYVFATMVMEGAAAEQLYAASSHLTADECRDAITKLNTFEKQRGDFALAELRERIRGDNLNGWPGRLLNVLSDIANTRADVHDSSTHRILQARAINRLLTLELGLRLYRLENGALPDRLEQLVPQILEQVPSDPFNPSGRPLHYRRTGDTCMAYSVGADGVDGNGRPPAKDPATWTSQHGDGDLRLDVLYAPKPIPAANTNATDAAEGPDRPRE
jgi:hypothetical protein